MLLVQLGHANTLYHGYFQVSYFFLVHVYSVSTKNHLSKPKALDIITMFYELFFVISWIAMELPYVYSPLDCGWPEKAMMVDWWRNLS